MSFLIQRAAGRGLTLTQIHGELLRIGRGTNQDLRSDNPAVALEHAVIESDAAGYLITDRGSITGTYVNRKPVESARLGKGDTIEIGDLRIEIQMADPAKPLFLRVVSVRAAAAVVEDEDVPVASVAATPGARVIQAKKIDYVSAYRLARPWLTKVSITALLLIVALAVIGEVIRPERQRAFMPGGLSSAHARVPQVANDCDACHSPWKSVSSSKCLDCHPHQPHAQFERDTPDCFTCHAEHRGATKLAQIADTTCTGCHANLDAHLDTARASLSVARSIVAFGEQHPDFAYPKDANSLRFNHKLHLNAKGIFNATGKREVLQCTGCHALGKTDPVPIDFEQHCQRCHKLTFDRQFPDTEVPHGGDPGIVYGFVGGIYSGNRELANKSAAEVRRILTVRGGSTLDAGGVLNAEKVFKAKCRQCHEIRTGQRLAVVAPVIRTSWLGRERFVHTRHTMVNCESCHAGVRESTATADVLMPRRENCTACHAKNVRTQTATPCVTCHEYHLRPQRQVVKPSLVQAGMGELGSGGRMLQGILLAVIVILLLVVLIPVGIALFQRLRPERVAPAPAARPAPPPPAAAPRVTFDAPTDKVSKQTAPPDLAPRAPDPVPVTKIAGGESPLDQPGTEMVQWNGMLHCTSGPLEGQRFIIEDEGFYIGRDPALAKVVVPDSRVSKRHVRILPRDGKVWAIDEGSTNGTYLREQRITEVQLKRGDTLILGDNAATFVYQI